jgi:hypothetical protein
LIEFPRLDVGEFPPVCVIEIRGGRGVEGVRPLSRDLICREGQIVLIGDGYVVPLYVFMLGEQLGIGELRRGPEKQELDRCVNGVAEVRVIGV